MTSNVHQTAVESYLKIPAAKSSDWHIANSPTVITDFDFKASEYAGICSCNQLRKLNLNQENNKSEVGSQIGQLIAAVITIENKYHNYQLGVQAMNFWNDTY